MFFLNTEDKTNLLAALRTAAEHVKGVIIREPNKESKDTLWGIVDKYETLAARVAKVEKPKHGQFTIKHNDSGGSTVRIGKKKLGWIQHLEDDKFFATTTDGYVEEGTELECLAILFLNWRDK